MHDHRSIGLFLGNGFFFVGNLALSVFAFSFSVFVLHEANKSPTHRILVSSQRERATLGRGFLSFHIYFGDKSTLFRYCLVQKTFLHTSSVFFRSLIGNFLSFCAFASSLSLIGNFLSFCAFF